MDKLRQLASAGATVIFSDIPGCGIGRARHVYTSSSRSEGDEFGAHALHPIVDPG